MESRYMQKYLPFKDWDWDKEVQSRILQMLDVIACQIANTHRKKGAKALKPQEQFQPDYVKDAKKQVKRNKKEDAKEDQAELAKIFGERNKNIKKLEGKMQ